MSIYQNIVDRSPIDKGWSGDQKYCATTADGQKYLLRISSIDRLERKRREYEKMSEVGQLGIPMCMPVAFGTCDEGAYSIQSWIDGADAESLVVAMGEREQYRYGLDAGRILAKIHTIPAPVDVPNWESRFNAKIDRKIAMYEACELKYESGGDAFLDYLAQNRHLLKDRPQSYQHGDYHIGNMMIDCDGVLNIIDFDRDDFGDPWEEFNRIVWCAQAAPAFASGMVDGYFDGERVIIRLKNSFHLKMLENKNASDMLRAIVRNIEGVDGEVVFEVSNTKTEQESDLSMLFDE